MVIDGQIYLKSTFNQDFDQLDGPCVRFQQEVLQLVQVEPII